MKTYFRTINDTNVEWPDFSDRFVTLAEKCLSFSRTDIFHYYNTNNWKSYKVSRVIWLPFGAEGYMPVPERFRFSTLRNYNPTLYDHNRELPYNSCPGLLSDIWFISQVMLTILQGIQIRLRENEDNPTDPLGSYHSIQSGSAPFIALYPRKIIACANRFPGMSIELLSAETLIHELAHAFLDPQTFCERDLNSQQYRMYQHSFAGEENIHSGRAMNFYHVREESLANIITYRVFYLAAQKGAIPKHYAKWVKTFISQQTAPYRLSLSMLPTPNIYGWIYAKFYEMIDQETANKWMEKAQYRLSIDPWGKSYSKSLLPKERSLNLPWAKDDFKKNESRGYNKYGDSVIGPWGISVDSPKSELEILFEPNHLIQRMDRYFLYDRSWNLIMEFPCDAVRDYSPKKGLVKLLEEDGKERWRYKSGIEEKDPKKWP